MFFDFSLTKKPIILFIYDYKEYTADRGMYLDVQDLPFRKITSAKELGRCLRGGECLADDYSDTDYSRTFLKYDSPDISEKLLKLAFTGDSGDLEVIDYGKNKEKTWQVLYPRALNGRPDLETLARLADDHTVALLERKWFKRDISPLLHDEFNDKFTYVITTMTTPRTYVEDLLCHLGVGADGALQLGGICLVAGLGGATRRDGSLAYYFSEPIVENDAKGVGPLLLAYTEILAAQKQ